MFNSNPRQQLAAVLHKELEAVLQFKPANRVDSEPVGLLDVIYAYRLFLGRWPEFDTVEAMKAKTANHPVLPFVMGFVNAPEFQVRVRHLSALDMVVMTEMSDGTQLSFNLRDRQAMRIASGIHELAIQEGIRRVISENPRVNCVDAGAHIGLYSILMAKAVGPKAKVYAFEPFPSTWQLLIRNIRQNGLADTVIPINAACHRAKARGRIFERDHQDLGEAYVETDATHAGGEEIDLVAVDEVVPADVRVGFIKMDIEGSEPAAIAGMQRILNNDRPIIFTEFNPGALAVVGRVQPDEYLSLLKKMGYRCREIDDFLADEQTEYRYVAGAQTANLVCEPV
jgi:FkbM family methyltransferase